MSNFRFKAVDGAGKTHEGILEAPSAQEAAKILAARGLQIRLIQAASAAAAPPPAVPQPSPRPNSPPSPARPTDPPASAPIVMNSPPGSAPQGGLKKAVARNYPTRPEGISQSAKPTGPVVIQDPADAALPTVRTIVAKDKERFFLFSQLAAAFRSGLNPAQALVDIGQRMPKYFLASMTEMSEAATEGIPLSRVMARYPDLYPPGVVGTIRVGEQGGFLPEACDTVAQQAENAHKFKRFFWFVWAIALNFLLAVPLMMLFRSAFLATWDQMDAMGELANPKDALRATREEFTRFLLWPIGPTVLVTFAILYVLWRFFGSRLTRRFRHALGLKWPVFGARTRHENLTAFSWALSRLSKAGLSPQSAWTFAAEALPNDVMRDEMIAIGQRVTHTERISDIVHGAKIFPDDYAPVIATAEYTGDLPGALDQLARMSNQEFETSTSYAKVRGGCWGMLGCLVTSAFLLGVFWYVWYYEFPTRVLKGFEPE